MWNWKKTAIKRGNKSKSLWQSLLVQLSDFEIFNRKVWELPFRPIVVFNVDTLPVLYVRIVTTYRILCHFSNIYITDSMACGQLFSFTSRTTCSPTTTEKSWWVAFGVKLNPMNCRFLRERYVSVPNSSFRSAMNEITAAFTRIKWSIDTQLSHISQQMWFILSSYAFLFPFIYSFSFNIHAYGHISLECRFSYDQRS